MRILLLSNLYPPEVEGGAELLAGEIAAGLAGQGHEVHVLAGSAHAEPLAEPLAEAEGGVRIRRTLRLAGSVHVDRNRPLWQQLDLPLRYYQRYHQRANAAELRRVVAAVRPDVLYVWEVTGLGVTSLLRALPETRLPLVFHLGSYWLLYARAPETDQSGLRARWLKRWLIGAVPSLAWTSLIAVSAAVKERYAAAGYDAARIEVIHNSVAPRFLRTPPTTRTVDAAGPVRLLFVGRLCREKGVMTALRALERLTGAMDQTGAETTPGGGTGYLLDIAGDGDAPYVGELRAYVAQAGLGERVVFHGRVPQEDLISYYDRADILLNTSLWAEPFGLTTVEAMARGLPVIATRVGASPEIVAPDVTGLLIEPDDDRALAAAIARLASDPARRAQLADAARSVVEEHFTIETNREQVARHLRRAVAGDATANMAANMAANTAARAADDREVARGGRRASR